MICKFFEDFSMQPKGLDTEETLPMAGECVTFSGKRKKGGNDNKKINNNTK
jgi:hypothetical protein